MIDEVGGSITTSKASTTDRFKHKNQDKLAKLESFLETCRKLVCECEAERYDAALANTIHRIIKEAGNTWNNADTFSKTMTDITDELNAIEDFEIESEIDMGLGTDEENAKCWEGARGRRSSFADFLAVWSLPLTTKSGDVGPEHLKKQR